MLVLLTQALLGAAVGEMVAGKRLGIKAMGLGALIGLLPDVDRLLIPTLGEYAYIQAGQAATHGLLGFAVALLALPWLLGRIFFRIDADKKLLRKLVGWIWIMHVGLDICGLQGVRLLYPFWNESLSLHLVPDGYVPLLVILSLFTALGGWRWKKAQARNLLVGSGVMLCLLCLTLAFTCRQLALAQFNLQWQARGSEVQRMGVMPTAGSPLLWLAIAELPYGYEVAYYSLMDDPQAGMEFFHYPKYHDIEGSGIGWETEKLLRGHTERFYLISNADSGLFWHDLRYGVLDVLGPDLLPKDYQLTYQLVPSDQKGSPNLTTLHAVEIPKVASIRYLWRRMWGEPITDR